MTSHRYPAKPACGLVIPGHLRQSLRYLFDRLPVQCPLCNGRASGGNLCPACYNDLIQAYQAWPRRCTVCCLPLHSDNGFCPDCAVLQPSFQRIIAAFDYAYPGDILIQQFKSARRFDHARFLARLLVSAIHCQSHRLHPSTIVVPVPSSRAALRRRGFNPAAEIARYLARYLGLRYGRGYVYRQREGEAQKGLSRSARLEQVARLYGCTAGVSGADIAVVDDVMTSGSTMQSIASLLQSAGARSVTGLVLARTPYRHSAY